MATISAMEHWSKGVSRPLAMVSHAAAVGAEELHDLLRRIDKQPSLAWALAKNVQPPDWFRCYDGIEAVSGSLLRMGEAMGMVPACGETTPNFQRWGQRLGRWHKRIWQGRGYRVERLLDRFCETYYREYHLPLIRDAIHEMPPMPESVASLLSSTEFVFALCVAMPSWLRLQKLPWRLFAEAVEGDEQSIRQLLEIDPVADQHPRLAARMFRIQQTNPALFRSLQAVKTQSRKKSTSPENVKVQIGGWLLMMSHLLQDVFSGELFIGIVGKRIDIEQDLKLKLDIKKLRAEADRHPLRSRMSARKVRELWNAFADDAGRGPTDTDLMAAPDSVERQLRRKAKRWIELWNSDNSNAA